MAEWERGGGVPQPEEPVSGAGDAGAPRFLAEPLFLLRRGFPVRSSEACLAPERPPSASPPARTCLRRDFQRFRMLRFSLERGLVMSNSVQNMDSPPDQIRRGSVAQRSLPCDPKRKTPGAFPAGKEAIERYGITDREQQKRLVARRVR